MQSIEYRYNHDPMVKALVDSLEHHIHTLQFTPSEIRECAMLAAIRYEQRRPPQSINEMAELAQQTNNQSSPKLPDYSVIVKELESTRKSRFELTNENYIGMQLMYVIIAGKIGR